MANTQNYNFPYFPPTPPHAPPSPSIVPPPHPPTLPPPQAAPPHQPIAPPKPLPPKAAPPGQPIPPPKPIPPKAAPPRQPIAPPPQPLPPKVAPRPPPPHPIHAPPPPPHIVPSPPPPSPGPHPTVIVIIFVSLGGLFFLAFLSVALCCFIKKRKNRTIQETDRVTIDGHLKIREAIVEGPHGPQTVVLSVDEDVHVQEEIKKNEIISQGSHFKSAHHNPQAPDMVASTSGSNNHHLDHKE